MKACRTASIFAAIPAALVLSMNACTDPKRIDVPSVTTATPNATPLLSGPATNPTLATAAPAPVLGASSKKVPAPTVTFVEGPFRLEEALCATTLFAVVKGSWNLLGETVGPNDAVAIEHALPTDVTGSGLAVLARTEGEPCPTRDRPAPVKKVVRGASTPKLTWAGGKMSAHLDVDTKQLYLGRLEGTAAVAEHEHTSWEILVAIEAAGTFTIDGKDSRLGPKQMVLVPPNTKHAWKADPGTRLVGIQMYAPPGPEQRFVGLAAAEKAAAGDAGPPPPKLDAGKP